MSIERNRVRTRRRRRIPLLNRPRMHSISSGVVIRRGLVLQRDRSGSHRRRVGQKPLQMQLLVEIGRGLINSGRSSQSGSRNDLIHTIRWIRGCIVALVIEDIALFDVRLRAEERVCRGASLVSILMSGRRVIDRGEFEYVETGPSCVMMSQLIWVMMCVMVDCVVV